MALIVRLLGRRPEVASKLDRNLDLNLALGPEGYLDIFPSGLTNGSCPGDTAFPHLTCFGGTRAGKGTLDGMP